MITANSFMKREFGKKLIEQFIPKIDLTHVVDTLQRRIVRQCRIWRYPTYPLQSNRNASGTRCRRCEEFKGEPSRPRPHPRDFVWPSILNGIDRAGAEDEFTSTVDVPRDDFCKSSLEHRRWRGNRSR